jgi:hypothetical protein
MGSVRCCAGHKVFCSWPHSLQAYSTRPWPTSAVTRLGAPHLLHFTSSRVLPRVMVTFRAIASLTKRSDSWRMVSLDIVGGRGLRIVSSITQQFQVAKPKTWPSFNLPVDALREPHPVIQGDHFGGLFTNHDRWRVGVAVDHVGHDARICNTQVQYSHDPEPWNDHVADPAKEDRMAPLIVMLIAIAVPLWVGWSSMSYEPSGGAAKARHRAAHLTFRHHSARSWR